MEYSDDFKRTINLVKRVFGGDSGTELLDVMREQFDKDNLVGNDTHETYCNLGQREVVRWIEHMLRIKLDE